jgi:hypothetical protein
MPLLLSLVHLHELMPLGFYLCCQLNCYFEKSFPLEMKFMNLTIFVRFRNRAS